ncbi:hypothetical protein HVY71_12505 [Citrobacter freundii]|nr:hypothetical protein HVY71_12505 [Citrobacter freundii]
MYYTYEDMCRETSKAYLAGLTTAGSLYEQEIEQMEVEHKEELNEVVKRACDNQLLLINSELLLSFIP